MNIRWTYNGHRKLTSLVYVFFFTVSEIIREKRVKMVTGGIENSRWTQWTSMDINAMFIGGFWQKEREKQNKKFK